ncbi:murein biosynthesis integral membrane protein MurJ [Alkalihalobacterium chitinilyticum]|uniref:Probable lipid II flippase MurJ n=1 Tax=Alkalihalobacterium chitinilyticum TaxID=2980103 RepID=A0ABT5VKP6_9BACI|nr:murein biosynthesis integral membrane protein MurJ [Alkalihalobacterium chitinilyticum]MDE5415845.1 murein biosynthesis integral membrane protein MurJ [Alkalihalobacterium chitinilyticum]
MGKAAVVIMVLTVIVKISGFLRDIALSYFYGATGVSDAYLISLTIPAVIFAFISVSITTSYIPLYTLIEKQKGQKYGITFSNNLLNILLIICSIIVLFCVTFTEAIVKVFASGFNGETLELAVMFTRVSVIGVYFSVLMAVYRGYLNVKNKFAAPALVALPNNLIILFAIFLSAISENLLVLAIGTLVGTVSQAAILVPYVYKEGFRPNLTLDIKDKYIKKFGIAAFPVILGVSINEINVLIDRTIASRIVEGAISALDYSFRLTQFINGTFAAAIAIAMYPVISKMVVEKNNKGLKKTISNSINMVSIIVIPITVITMLFSEDIIKILYGRGAFDQTAITLTAGTLFYYSIGILAYGYREIITRAFFANQDTKTPMVTAVYAMILNIILNIILSKYMGTSGLALATSVAGIFGSVLLLLNYRKKIAEINYKNIATITIKVTFASLIMGGVSYIIKVNLIENINVFFALIISVIIAFFIYFITLIVLEVKEVKEITNIIQKKVIRRKEK